MLRNILYSAILLLATLLVRPALSAGQGAAGQQGASFADGISIPEVPGKPFSATAVLETERYWSDGSSQVRRTINLVARDSEGRTHNEVRRLMPEYFHGSPQLLSVRLFDPLTGMHTDLDPVFHVARQQLIPKKPNPAVTPNPALRIEDLGTTTMNGLQAKGTRRTTTIAAKASGTGDPVEIEDEFWYSDELDLNLLVRHSDPRVGVDTVGLSNLKREEPPAGMFQIPAGYQVINVAPASGRTDR
ncbi:MAG TPA: hypothetical protein VI320_16815 [Terracidiphilus sp.]|jgi:hypothetical protein